VWKPYREYSIRRDLHLFAVVSMGPPPPFLSLPAVSLHRHAAGYTERSTTKREVRNVVLF
jgi:hypothetical protein